MSSEIKDGGPAFPIPDVSQNQSTGETVVHQSYQGLSIRDYFAAKAMQAMCSPSWPDSFERPEIAKRAYCMADDMIAAREKQS